MTQNMADHDMPKAYDPKAVEPRIYNSWLKAGHFTPSIDRSKTPFTIIMPPPNVTGQLHMGHALTTAIEDLMVRWHRMKDNPSLYLPGTDHAGIATQVVVERMLAADGISRHDLGRDRFIEHVWKWVEQYGDAIYEQLKRLGASCDWSRQRFTLDDGPSKAVRTTFVNLYKKGLIYRGERINNWCPRCRTALSDLEVKHQEENAALYHIRYAMDKGDGSVIVATTRPETLLGDTAVAVSPHDDRYRHLVGQHVVLPMLGRVIPIIADEAVDPELGTGALKVTPGHAIADFEIGQRHQLDIVNVISLDGTMNENAGHYAGRERIATREAIVEDLDNAGLLEKIERYQHSVGHCDRCDDVVEPIVSKQWYVRMETLAKPAREAVAKDRIDIIPERFAKVYFNWLDNIRDWCISRQLWWGHRIPVWYCDDCDEVTVEMVDPAVCTSCRSENLTRDPDVLDTWFSSALWTHSTLGWPDNTEDFDYFYPTSVMETGYDILFFWVSRMIMMGIENTDREPFHTVYLHGLVLDPQGVKMSKTKGNVLDPLDLIDLYGADALRFALTTGNSPGNNMRLNEQKLEASRNFANKLWNAARFVISKLDDHDAVADWQTTRSTHRHDRWILSRLSRVTSEIDELMEQYQFGEAQRVVHDFLWGEYCDWYIEMAKTRLPTTGSGHSDIDEDIQSPLPVLAYVLEHVLRLLHPFMPFITEEIWARLGEHLPRETDSPEALIVAPYPRANPKLIDEEAEVEVGAVIEIVRSVRNLRAEFRIQPSQALDIIVDSPDYASVVESEAPVLGSLGRVQATRIGVGIASEESSDTVSLVLSTGTVAVPLGGLVDLDKEMDRLNKELYKLSDRVDSVRARLSNEKFSGRAPEDVVERERQRLQDMEDRHARISEILSKLGPR